MSSSPPITMSFSFLLFFSLLSITAKATVPSDQTFELVNEGEFGPYIVEYDGNYRPLGIGRAPFQLCFYNTTPNAFTLALRMATTRATSLYRWVWEANRGNPVRENATLKFGTDGNLVLADADGRVAWQTNTANKGVVGFRLLPNGNMVLYDSKGNFIWQSFDYPTDTLLVGQSLKVGGATKLVSRASEQVNSDGPYSLVMESKAFTLYYKSPNSATPLPYYSSSEQATFKDPFKSLTLRATPDADFGLATDITLDINSVNSSSGSGGFMLVRPKYNSTLSILRLGIDGNLRVYTYYDPVDWYAWEQTFTLLSRDRTWSWESECQLPERCGNFGVCNDNQCVACPSPNGLLGWSEACQPTKVSCQPKDFGYYKIEGVDHFMSKYKTGTSLTESDCGKKCTTDCKCLGYFYHRETSKCWIAYDLKTLTKISNTSHVGYIKKPNK